MLGRATTTGLSLRGAETPTKAPQLPTVSAEQKAYAAALRKLTPAQQQVVAGGAVRWNEAAGGWEWVWSDPEYTISALDIVVLKWDGVKKPDQSWPATPLQHSLGSSGDGGKLQKVPTLGSSDCAYDAADMPAHLSSLVDKLSATTSVTLPLGLAKACAKYLVLEGGGTSRADKWYKDRHCIRLAPGPLDKAQASLDQAIAERAAKYEDAYSGKQADVLGFVDVLVEVCQIAGASKPSSEVFTLSPLACSQILGIPEAAWFEGEGPPACSSQMVEVSQVTAALILQSIIEAAVARAHEKQGVVMDGGAKAKSDAGRVEATVAATAAAVGGGALLLWLLSKRK